MAVKILVPGVVDHELVRQASRSGFGRMLRAGVEIYEYRGALLHSKTMVVDGVWGTVGSANFDNRSFALNQEINLTLYDRRVGVQMQKIFADDLAHASPITLHDWNRRSLKARIYGLISIPIKDQL